MCILSEDIVSGVLSGRLFAVWSNIVKFLFSLHVVGEVL